MPKVSSSTPALRRNQACKQCRKRKLKCDASRPHCGTCVRQWTAQVAVPPPVGFSHPTEPTCTYDPVEGLTLLPAESVADNAADKIKLLERQIEELQGKLRETVNQNGQRRSGSPYVDTHGPSPPPFHLNPSPTNSFRNVGSPDANGNDISLPRASLGIPIAGHNRHGQGTFSRSRTIFGHSRSNSISSMDGNSREQFDNIPSISGSRNSGNHAPDPYMDLLFSGWNHSLPTPDVLHHLVDIFFRCDPCGSRILHRPSLLASLALPPNHPDFPHPALLHAICASASRWTSNEKTITADGKRRDPFSEYHASKTRSYIDQTMASGASIFPVLQACIILSWWFYSEGRWVEVWIHAGFQTRVSVPLGLNHRGTHATKGVVSPYLAPPTDAKDLEMRRRAWWMALMFDRIVSVGGWLHSVDERDIGTEFPLRASDFESESLIQDNVPSNPQTLHTEGVLIQHPINYTDPFILFIKACMLFGKVTDYNVRMSLHAPAVPRKGDDPRMAPGFRALDRLVSGEFIQSLPSMYRHCLGVGEAPDGSRVDSDLYLVHLIPHAATITLHNPYINFSAISNCPSAARCLDAARSILTAYYLITSTSFDITRLHPFVTICWYLAAVVQVQLCKRLIEIGDRANEANVWGEINLLRLAMLQYGQHSPIGVRQEKLLQGLMTDILQMTTQAQPLAVGVPLYPFSLASAFADGRTAEQDPANAALHMAPLPDPSRYDEDPSVTVSPDIPPPPVPVSVPSMSTGASTGSSSSMGNGSISVPSVPSMSTTPSSQDMHDVWSGMDMGPKETPPSTFDMSAASAFAF